MGEEKSLKGERSGMPGGTDCFQLSLVKVEITNKDPYFLRNAYYSTTILTG